MKSENGHLLEPPPRLRLAWHFSEEFDTQQQRENQQRRTTLDISRRVDSANAGFNRQRK
jgi:hypothetical protein